jgi:transposase
VGCSCKLSLQVQAYEASIERGRREAGWFVLITNEPFDEDGGVGSVELLRIYKEQHPIERNFGFLKDPLIVNALFLKSPQRMEALGLILVLALMVWRLMERTMGPSLKERGKQVICWDGRRTSRATSFMMTTKFGSVIVPLWRANACRATASPTFRRTISEYWGCRSMSS